MLTPGESINGYVIIRKIASGGFGTIYEADHANRGRVAVKVLHEELASSADSFLRFLREIHILELLCHANVVDIYDSGVLTDGRAYFVMELLTGENLAARIERDGPMKTADAVSILRPVCEALATAHQLDVVHRDLKASNIFLARDGDGLRVVVLDFGLAKLLEAGARQLTASNVVLGTPATLAPEQIQGEPADRRTDVYALGALTYHMLVGSMPFAASTTSLLQYMHLHGERPKLSEQTSLGPAVDEVVSRAMSIRQQDRYATPAQFLDDLCEALGDAGAVATSPGAVAPKQAERVEQGLGIYLEVRMAPDAQGADPDPASLDAISEILLVAQDYLCGHGFASAFEASNATLFVRILAGAGWDERQERRAALMLALDLEQKLAPIAERSALCPVNLCLHWASVQVDNAQVKGGDLLRLHQWVPTAAVDGVVGTAAALSGLEVEGAPIADQWLRVRRVRNRS